MTQILTRLTTGHTIEQNADPATDGVHRIWISDHTRRVVGYGHGETHRQAIDAAVLAWVQKKPYANSPQAQEYIESKDSPF